MSIPLQNKTAVITGASHGLGAAVARKLADQGAHVCLIARGMGPLQETAGGIRQAGGKASIFPCDISDKDQVSAAATQIQNACGSVEILVNNAGIPAPRTFEDTDFADWDAVIGTNLSGAFYLTRALWDALIAADGAYVITVSGTSGLRGGGSPAYGGSKFGLTGLNSAIAAAGKDHNIRATILYPGGMDTGWRGAPIGVLPRSQSMDPDVVANMIAQLLESPPDFVVNEAVLNPLEQPFM